MKYFLSLLLTLFFAAASAQVTIPDNVSGWFLEQNEKVKLYQEQVKDLRADITLLEKQITIQKTEVSTYIDDSGSYRSLINLKQKELNLKEKELKQVKREIIKYKIIAGIAIGASIVLIILHG